MVAVSSCAGVILLQKSFFNFANIRYFESNPLWYDTVSTWIVLF